MEEKHFESLYPEDAMRDEISAVVSNIKSGNSCQLLGLPGAGRSELVELLAYNKQIRDRHLGENSKYVHFVLVDFSELRKRPLFDAMKFLFLGLAESLRERKMMDEYRLVNDAFREALSFSDELVLFQELKQAVDFLALEKKLTLVFLFNRFEDYVPTVTGEFFRNLRILRDRAKYRFSVVFSVNRPLELLLEPSLLADFYEYVAGNLVYIGLYDEASQKFLTAYLERLTGKKLSRNMREEILRLTGGHAKLMRLATEICLAHGQEDGGGLGEFLSEQKPIRAALSEIWLALSPAEQSDVEERKFEDPAVDKYLEDAGLIKDGRVQVPLLETYVSSSKMTMKEEGEKIMYDENTNTIRNGRNVLSDSLTSSEFRLLRYLLQNQERVIERDEIISIVWQGVKSTAGITDQAVDQLIFRLRRKIEEDPNSPQHLQTVKGRGVRFVV